MRWRQVSNLQAAKFTGSWAQECDSDKQHLIVVNIDALQPYGLEMLRGITADPQLHGTPVIVISESFDPDFVRGCFEGRATAYIVCADDAALMQSAAQVINDHYIMAHLEPRVTLHNSYATALARNLPPGQ